MNLGEGWSLKLQGFSAGILSLQSIADRVGMSKTLFNGILSLSNSSL